MHGWGDDDEDDDSSIEEPLPEDEDPFLSIEDEESSASPDSGSDYVWSESVTGEGELIRVEVDIDSLPELISRGATIGSSVESTEEEDHFRNR